MIKYILLLLPMFGYSQVDVTIKREMDAWKKSEQHLYGRINPTYIKDIHTTPNRLKLCCGESNDKDTLLCFKFNIIRRLAVDSISMKYLAVNKKQDYDFIDTIQIIVVLHHLDDVKPNESVSTKKCFMERKGEYLKSYFEGIEQRIKAPTETKVFYYKYVQKLIEVGDTYGTLMSNGYEKVEVVIPKKQILQIFEINN